MHTSSSAGFDEQTELSEGHMMFKDKQRQLIGWRAGHRSAEIMVEGVCLCHGFIKDGYITASVVSQGSVT